MRRGALTQHPGGRFGSLGPARDHSQMVSFCGPAPKMKILYKIFIKNFVFRSDRIYSAVMAATKVSSFSWALPVLISPLRISVGMAPA